MLTEHRRQWQRARRAKAAARGRCSTCVTNWPEFPNKTCNDCLDVAARQRVLHPREGH